MAEQESKEPQDASNTCCFLQFKVVRATSGDTGKWKGVESEDVFCRVTSKFDNGKKGNVQTWDSKKCSGASLEFNDGTSFVFLRNLKKSNVSKIKFRVCKGPKDSKDKKNIIDTFVTKSDLSRASDKYNGLEDIDLTGENKGTLVVQVKVGDAVDFVELERQALAKRAQRQELLTGEEQAKKQQLDQTRHSVRRVEQEIRQKKAQIQQMTLQNTKIKELQQRKADAQNKLATAKREQQSAERKRQEAQDALDAAKRQFESSPAQEDDAGYE